MTTDQLEFATYCIGNVARALGWSQPKTYSVLNKSGVLKDYIVGCYDVAHTFSKPYIIEDIEDFLKRRNAI
ncbi:MAG: DUF3791 domain-containing protein [Salinivirgaceae bacterium]|nr:DUF3791 domain-containing protein [Salinivirgaceae bacterium]MBR6083483.1 DUF3791 domain-containing protein [Salinivirgaceae bacterium]